MNRLTWLGLGALAGSQFQLLLPASLVERPRYVFFGYAFIPGNLLAFSSALFTLGVIVLSEGVIRRFNGFSLWQYASVEPRRLLGIALAASGAGLALEAVGQWLGKLWIYPYWTTWLYGIVVLPGFAFYWLSLVQTYLAAKAFLDSRAHGHAVPARVTRRAVLGALGLACLAAAGLLYVRWYAAHGYVFAVTRPTADAPPLGYAMLAFLGGWATGEWILRRRGSPSFLASAVSGYRVPVAAVFISALPLALVMEGQNMVHHFWRYTHFPWPAVLAMWPLQYVVFLTAASVAVPSLASACFARWPDRSS